MLHGRRGLGVCETGRVVDGSPRSLWWTSTSLELRSPLVETGYSRLLSFLERLFDKREGGGTPGKTPPRSDIPEHPLPHVCTGRLDVEGFSVSSTHSSSERSRSGGGTEPHKEGRSFTHVTRNVDR